MPRPLLLIQLLLLQISLNAQVQWYQNQDGNNQFPNSTSAMSVQALGSSSFIACYLWTTNFETYTWKISKTNLNGVEEKTLFISGTTAQVEVKVGTNNSIYVLKKNYPFGQNPEYIVYKLNSNLVVVNQKTISFPNGYNIINLNDFEMDGSNNVYLAGDGQYPVGPGFGSASFVLKTDKNLATKWKWMDSTQTSFSRLLVDGSGVVTVLADYYDFFPDIHMIRINASGQNVRRFTIEADPGRYTLSSALDDHDNVFIYGSKFIGDTAQGMYLFKFSKNQERIVFRKTHFAGPALQFNDLKIDEDGNIFSLVNQYQYSGEMNTRISKINSSTGNISWNKTIPYAQDSCNLSKLIVSGDDRFYAVGYRQSNNYFCKAFALRMKKNGHSDGNIPAPDSVNFQKLHWLSDGIIDQNKRLIAIGGTSNLDTTTFTIDYLKAFAVRYSDNNCNPENKSSSEAITLTSKNGVEEKEELQLVTRLAIYPNPVTERLNLTGMNKNEYDLAMIYNMQGEQILKQSIAGTSVQINVNMLAEGMYLLVLHSSASLQEKNLKFVVKR
jgi:hypothetical protein